MSSTSQAKDSKKISNAGPARRYLTLKLGSEIYGLDILRVQEILQMVPITRIPRVPEYVTGVINLRGQVIPVIDAKLRFSIPEGEISAKPCIIVIRVDLGEGDLAFGLRVDEVQDVITFQAEDIQPPLSRNDSAVDSIFVQGIGIRGKELVILLDISKVIADTKLDTEVEPSSA